MHDSDSSSSSRPSSLACLPCRHRHLKCDARMPVCSRCHASSTDCRYVRSRRGLRTKTASANCAAPPSLDDMALFHPDSLDWLDVSTLPAALDTDPLLAQALASSDTLLDLPDDDALDWPEVRHQQPPPPSSDLAYDPMIQLYYQNFHRSHPLLIPRKALRSPQLSQRIPPYLLAIMRYIGAHYYPDPVFKETLHPYAYFVLSEAVLRDAFKVQGMLLLAIVEHSHGAEDSAHRIMQAAIDLALELGMEEDCFAKRYSSGSQVLEESWRRTYWELYVVDGLMAAMRDNKPFRLYSQRTNVRIPCGEEVYNSNADTIPPLGQTIEDISRVGQTHAHSSSFAYRIQAVQNLGRVLELNRSLESRRDEAQVECVDAMLVASLMHLPSAARKSIYDGCDPDELIFQTQMITYLAIIYLHHPRSTMRFASFHSSSSPSRTSCTHLQPHAALPPSCTSVGSSSSSSSSSPNAILDTHSQKFLRAADHLVGLATMPSAIKYRTPFFTCALAMCVIVHTAACLMDAAEQGGQSERAEALKARIQLGFGGLNVLGRVWPLARTVRGQMVEMCREVGVS